MTCDVFVADESQELTGEQLAALLPTISAGRLQNNQTILIGTPPAPGQDGEVFSYTRKNALSGDAARTCWHEWSVDELGDTSDWQRVWDTNPALDIRLMRSAVESEMRTMAPDFFARERLGWWSKQTVNAVIDAADWSACATDSPPMDGTTVYAVKFSADGAVGTLAACIKPQDGAPHVEVVDARRLGSGTAWLADWLAPRAAKAAQIVVDGRSYAQPLVDELHRRGVGKAVTIIPKSSEMADACSELLNAVRERSVTHYDQPSLNDSATKSTRRNIGSGGGWGFAANDSDPTLVEACALARWAAMKTKRRPGRKARVSF